MAQPKLYLLVGYPGAGKTTVSKIIADHSGAVHIWADVERHKMFPNPTHSQQESNELYKLLNQQTAQLLKEGKSVVFDTNFNYFNDRQKLRQVAKDNGAETVVVWVTTAADIAKDRSVKSHQSRNLYELTMTEEQFDTIANKLEKPTHQENLITIDSSKMTEETIVRALGL